MAGEDPDRWDDGAEWEWRKWRRMGVASQTARIDAWKQMTTVEAPETAVAADDAP